MNIRSRQSSSDGTEKFLFELKDGSLIESVLIPKEKGDALCLSTQVGCKLGCKFCRTSSLGFQRNLETEEITGQLRHINELTPLRKPVSVMFMGMGEPLLNYDSVMEAFHQFIDQSGFDISHKRITLSTSGIVPGLERLAREKIKPNLAYSLNATTSEVRRKIMPIEDKYPMEEVLNVLKNFPPKTSKKPILEYILIKDLNDSSVDAERLGEIAKELKTKINLIGLNTYPECVFNAPSAEELSSFRELTASMGVTVTIRQSRGQDISAACGMLAGKNG